MNQKRLTSEERKQQILDQSLKIIYYEGFANLTIKNIAEQVGISQAAIYRHFSSKHHIVTELTDLVLLAPIVVVPDPDNCNPSHLLHRIIARQMQILAEKPYLTVITCQGEIFHEYEDIRENFIRHREHIEQQITSIVKCGQEKGIFLKTVDPEIFALIYMGSMRQSMQKWCSLGFGYSLPEEGKKIADELSKLLKGTD